MSRIFDYQAATPEEIAMHLLTVTQQAFSRTLQYYVKKDNTEMSVKLQKARILSQIYKLQQDLEALG